MRAVRTLTVPCLMIAGLLATGPACAARAPRAKAAPLDLEGLVLVYLAPPSAETRRLSFTVEELAAVGPAGPVVLEQRLGRLDLAALRDQRLLAMARLPPGSYDGLSLRISKGALATGTGQAAELVSPEVPVEVRGPFSVTIGSVTVLSLAVTRAGAGDVFQLAPGFGLAPADRPIPSLMALVSGPSMLTQVDRRKMSVGGADAFLRGPQGVAVDVVRGVAYVAEAAADVVAVLELSSGARLREIRLRPGDRPGAIALSRDTGVLVVVNRGPETVTFVETQSELELGRAAVGQDPTTLLIDRQDRFAYVVCRASNAVTVLDLATREAVGSLATDPAPAGVALGQKGDRLYVAHAGSPYLASFVLPDRTSAGRVFVGLGASAVHVDPNTGLIALAMGDERVIRFYAPGQTTPVGQVDLPGAATRLLVDDVEHALVALVPETRNLLTVDLATRRIRAMAELPEQPGELAMAGERR